ncbi:hypothetical protein CH63R_06475 [Colletotrichum higginsianum IMI 349063]|uniref:Uncharacterized protein n=1 Tax=Colletotrichum higginsianum (strain IMI 349063) TaxID=759273 RepID=A0A1B7YFA9_COLHI|nr:hypothetical protein CH63R_06475 [Colletotrichum higginsianum IMI 349063]OBR10783.1 hypothetical protein CH63R_06475 [Colletotrichum higginsianum IMI 349063]
MYTSEWSSSSSSSSSPLYTTSSLQYVHFLPLRVHLAPQHRFLPQRLISDDILNCRFTVRSQQKPSPNVNSYVSSLMKLFMSKAFRVLRGVDTRTTPTFNRSYEFPDDHDCVAERLGDVYEAALAELKCSPSLKQIAGKVVYARVLTPKLYKAILQRLVPTDPAWASLHEVNGKHDLSYGISTYNKARINFLKIQ